MALAPVEIVPITASCTLIATLVGMAVQRRITRSAADVEARRRKDEAELARMRELELAPRKHAIERQGDARLQLLKLFTDVQPELDVFRLIRAGILREANADEVTRLVLRSLGPRLDDHMMRSACPYLAQLTDPLERWLVGSCADIVGNWDEFDTFHGREWFVQMIIAAECALYATQVIGASLRGEPVPLPPRALMVRLSEGPSLKALRQRRPSDWKSSTKELALIGFGPNSPERPNWDSNVLSA